MGLLHTTISEQIQIWITIAPPQKRLSVQSDLLPLSAVEQLLGFQISYIFGSIKVDPKHSYVSEQFDMFRSHIEIEQIFEPYLSVHFSFMPEIKIQERTAEALREVATKRKCPTCGERKIDVNIIKKKYRV